MRQRRARDRHVVDPTAPRGGRCHHQVVATTEGVEGPEGPEGPERPFGPETTAAWYRQKRDRRVLFDDVADGYDARPPYPDAMYEGLTDAQGLGPGCEVVEIGPGTGQATRRLLDLGCRVTAVELGARMADRLAERTSGRAIDIVRSSFEDADLPAGAFDVVLSATAFHWVDPEVAIPKAFELLRPGGWLVLIWNVFGDPSRPDPFHLALSAMLEQQEPELAAPTEPGVNSPDGDSWAALLEERAPFGPVSVESIPWTGTHTTAELRALFATFSSWISHGPERMDALLDQLAALSDEQFGGEVSRPYQTVVVTARRPLAPG